MSKLKLTIIGGLLSLSVLVDFKLAILSMLTDAVFVGLAMFLLYRWVGKNVKGE